MRKVYSVNKKLRTPIQWFGGKGQMKSRITPLLEHIPHQRYCEPFGGGASILLSKDPVELETYNDLDSGLYNFFTVLADPETFEQFYRRVALLPYSRELYNDCRATWRDEIDKVKRTVKWYVVARMSFSGKFGASLSTATSETTTGRAKTVTDWLSIIKLLPEIHARLQRVQIENADALTVLTRYDTPETLFYCDPPYVMSTRKAGGYAHEMTDADHAALIERLKQVDGFVVLSGYDNPLYDALGWQKLSWQTMSNAAGRTRNSGLQGKGNVTAKQQRTETLWFNPRAWAFIEGDIPKWATENGSAETAPREK